MTQPDWPCLTEAIKAHAISLGCVSCGVTAAEPFPRDRAAASAALEAGYLAGMDWMTADRLAVSSDPHHLLPTARSIISLAVPYDSATLPPPIAGRPLGRIARYAWGRDYHKVLIERMRALVAFIEQQPLSLTGERSYRTLVDTARVFDRAIAARAGVGWVGKNTNVITHQAGSWVLLGEIVTELDLIPDAPQHTHCGSCVRCLVACPTGAIVAPYTIDATRCISYLTIEHRGSIPRHLRPLMGAWVFGCDICQDVCPPNLKPTSEGDAALRPADVTIPHPGFPDLVDLLALTEERFRQKFAGSAVRRAHRDGLVRNAAVALGNSGDLAAITPLCHSLAHDPSPLVRGHVAWALGRLGGRQALAALRSVEQSEPDALAHAEIALALIDCVNRPDHHLT